MPVIRMVVFDMDGVLCRYRIERRLALLASWSGQTPETIHAALWGSGFEDEAERGVLSADDYLLGFGERMHYPLSAAQWVEARRVAMEPDQAVLALARRLRRACPVGMFTNNPWLLQRHIAEGFPAVPDLFGPRAVFSAEVGRSKPDPEAFRRLATRLECTPEEMLYFDDDASYVASAREVELSAYQVGGAAGVRAGLAAHGLQRCRDWRLPTYLTGRLPRVDAPSRRGPIMIRTNMRCGAYLFHSCSEAGFLEALS
jgi:putative hydrolase of the HAD superfamily